jgi:hypothetical protein
LVETLDRNTWDETGPDRMVKLRLSHEIRQIFSVAFSDFNFAVVAVLKHFYRKGV